MKQKRSLKEILFGPQQAEAQGQNFSTLKMMAGYNARFTSWGDHPYATEVVRTAVDAVARNAAKLKPRHIRHKGGKIEDVHDDIQRVLHIRPNVKMSTYDFLYKMVTMLMLENNAFAIQVYKNGMLDSLVPVNYETAEFLENPRQEIYVRFNFAHGDYAIWPYEKVIHLRRHFFKNDMMGDRNDALNTKLDVIHTVDEGLAEAIRTSANLKGILKYEGMLSPKDIEKNRQAFVDNFLKVSNAGGIAALDSKADYKELKGDPKIADAEQMKDLRNGVYSYFGVNEKIVNSSYSEDEWNAFYESVLEPIAVQMGLEMTHKLFTLNEVAHGNEILFEANRLQYASARTKIALARELMPMGALTLNEVREIFNLAPVEDGDQRIQSLNYIHADKADQYQVGAPEGEDVISDDDPGNERI